MAIVVEEDPLVPCGPPEAGGEPPHLVQGRVQALPVPATQNQQYIILWSRILLDTLYKQYRAHVMINDYG